jgi:hypothetical protein
LRFGAIAQDDGHLGKLLVACSATGSADQPAQQPVSERML